VSGLALAQCLLGRGQLSLLLKALQRLLDHRRQPREPEPEEKKPSEELNVDAVFAKLKQIGGAKSE